MESTTLLSRKHDALRVGTVAAILADVGAHFELTKNELIERLFR